MKSRLNKYIGILAMATSASMAGISMLHADTNPYSIDCTTSPDVIEPVRLDLESETAYVGECQFPIHNINYEGISEITDDKSYIWNSIGRYTYARHLLLSGSYDIIDFFILIGDLAGVEILLDMGYVTGQGNEPSLSYVGHSLLQFDLGYDKVAKRRSDFLAIVNLLAVNSADVSFEIHNMTFFESFIMSYCSALDYQQRDLDDLSGYESISTTPAEALFIEKIFIAAELELYDYDCVYQLARHFNIK